MLKLCNTWIIAHIIIFFTADKFVAINPWRFVNTPFFVFYAVTGTYGIIKTAQYLKKHRPEIPLYLPVIAVTLIIIAASILTYRYSLNYNLERTWYEIHLGYPKTEDYRALFWLSE